MLCSCSLATFVLTVLLMLGTALGATYYVSSQGQDAHTCAQAQQAATARATINQGIACLASGDTLLVAPGTYHEQLSDVDDREHPGTVRVPPGASWAAPTTIRAQQRHKAILNKPQPGDPYNHVVYLGRADTQYVSIEGLVIDGRGHGACVWLGPGSHLRLAGNRIVNCGGNGVYGAVADDGSGGTDLQIVGNEIAGVAQEQTDYPGAHAIYFTGNHSRIAGNFVHGCPFYGIHASSEKGGLHHNVFESNRVKGCGQAGIMNQGGDSVIRNNLLEGNGIGVQCNGSGNQLVAHNTIYGWWLSPFNGDDSYGILDLSDGCTISNNVILQQRDVSSVPRYLYWLGSPTVSGNLCDGTYPQQCQLHVEDATTVLVDAPAGDLRLKEGSPAIDRGNVLSQVQVDRIRTARPQGAGADLGAFEGTGGTAPPIPPDPPQPPAGTALTCQGLLGSSAGALVLLCTPAPGR